MDIQVVGETLFFQSAVGDQVTFNQGVYDIDFKIQRL